MRITIFVIFLSAFFVSHVQALEWKEKKSDHFIIRYPSNISQQWASDVLRASEKYYDSIAKTIDYPRYNNYWSWENRVEITIFPNKKIFLANTGQPEWSSGGAIHKPWLSKQRRIVTYYQEENFFEGLLPHEISHLILFDFIGYDRDIPLWFNEGIAQLHEQGKSDRADQLMKTLVRNNQYISLMALFSLDIRQESEENLVGTFYAQSLSLIDFMIKKYGSNRFGILCRALRDKKSFSQALQSSYPMNISTGAQLEKKWLSYMKN